MKKPTAIKKSFLKALRRKGRVQQLEAEKTCGKFRGKAIETKKTTQQERKLFRKKPLHRLVDGE